MRAILLVLLIIFNWIYSPLIAIANPIKQNIPTVVSEVNGYPVLLPDTDNLNWHSMPSLEDNGTIQFPAEVIETLGYDPSRSWKAGDRPSDILMLGDLSAAFGLEQLSLDRILEITVSKYGVSKFNQLTGLDVTDLTLADFEALTWQTVPDLLEAIPGLEDLPLDRVKPLYDLFETIVDKQQGVEIASNLTVGSILNFNADWGNIQLGDFLDLGNYDLRSSIPGLINNPIVEFSKWGKTVISRVPGLNLLPFSFFPFSLGLLNQFAVIDLAWGSSEYCQKSLDKNWFVTGSAAGGQTIIKKCEQGKRAAYLELSDLPSLPTPLFKGKRFISGSDQKVDGGKGILKAVGGGVEPTGRLVYANLKVQVTDIKESTGLIKTAIGLNFCYRTLLKDFGCTPYVFWIPWITYSEGMLFAMGGQAVPQIPTIITPVKERENKPVKEEVCSLGGIFQYPVSTGVKITSHFGYRTNPVNGRSQFHGGTDFGTNFGSSVFASDGGIVAQINNRCPDWGKSQSKLTCGGKGGNWVFINHENGYQTRYLHLQLGTLKVKTGDRVCRGQLLGKSGNSGSSTGPHLHFEILINGSRVNPINHFQS